MIQFTKLRINGFKSFVERTEMEIAPGLNGIVGPNGCGKSNLVEALRWVMGENSAKRMRGGTGGMEDVIFNGTDQRSARNIAEVSLLLDNSKRTAPAAYNNSDEIEIIRKIERDHGSVYKINGKTVRARDVQMLFADTVTGANSPALVSQGRVTQIIQAKPIDRRMILEESAGISGLFVRRHEAELRLKAADANLLRIDDVFGSMEGRLQALKRQARQATRYRNVNTQIRQFEILVAFMEWSALDERMNKTRERFEHAESAVAEKLGAVTQLTRTQNVQAEDVSPLRQKEAEIAAALQAQKLALQRLEDEAGRLNQIMQETSDQLTQTQTDEAHERTTLQESTETQERLELEQTAISAQQSSEGGKLEQKEKARDELETKVIALEEKHTALMQGEAEAKARKASLEQQIQQNSERLVIVQGRRARAEEDLAKFAGQDSKADEIKKLESEISDLSNKAEKLDEEIEAGIEAHQKAQKDVAEAREVLKAAENKRSEFNAEITMLQSFFAQEQDRSFAPVLDSVTTENGFEKALSRALGDALLGSLEDDAPVRWVERKSKADMQALPVGVQSLLPHVKAPKELHLALSQIGLVRDEAQGNEQVHNLAPGQSLVSESGTYWRWDGFTVQAEASDRNALHLEHKNRLKDLEAKQPKIVEMAQKAQDVLERALEIQNAAEADVKANQSALRTAQQEANAKRDELGRLKEQQVRLDSETARLKDAMATADEDIKTLMEVVNWDCERLKAYEEEANDKQSEDTEKVRRSLMDARESHNAAIRAFDQYQQEQNSRMARLHAIADERINLQNRTIRARERLKQLEERKAFLTQKLEELKNQPRESRADQENLLTRIAQLEQERSEAAEQLAVRENEVSETGKALKQAESELAEMREDRAGAQATLVAMTEQRDSMETHIREQFGMAPAELPEHSAIDMDKELGDIESLKQKKEKLIRERENIGAVNLRADEEAEVLEKEVGTLLNERNDLMQAIEELRGGIAKINAEARERLVGAFEHVNSHFQKLFTTLFGGGKAHLALIDSEDPLEGGLEIFAQPPGKTLQSLSLLSGGEQTLASIALIFAMFLTNPSPICVLDEIDAPLDDANVERVCNLLEELARRGETRFVIITHHRMTMARMDRLYGVTMAEKGVSQLVSVDLQQSFDFLEAA